MVSYRGTDGKQSYHQVDELADAIKYVEHLRNDESVDHARIFKLEELSFEFRPYYRVEIATALPPPPAVDGMDEAMPAPMPVVEMALAPEVADDEDPLAAAWSATERQESHIDEHVGAGVGRRGLFGR